jgi:hypothetical protein
MRLRRELFASLPPLPVSGRVHAAYRDQRQAEVPDLGEQAVQRRLVATWPAITVTPLVGSLVICNPSNHPDHCSSRRPSMRIS